MKTLKNQTTYFGEELRLIRQKYNLSILETAHTSGLTRNTVLFIENGKRTNPQLLTAIKLLSIFPLSSSEILHALGYHITIDEKASIPENRYIQANQKSKNVE